MSSITSTPNSRSTLRTGTYTYNFKNTSLNNNGEMLLIEGAVNGVPQVFRYILNRSTGKWVKNGRHFKPKPESQLSLNAEEQIVMVHFQEESNNPCLPKDTVEIHRFDESTNRWNREFRVTGKSFYGFDYAIQTVRAGQLSLDGKIVSIKRTELDSPQQVDNIQYCETETERLEVHNINSYHLEFYKSDGQGNWNLLNQDLNSTVFQGISLPLDFNLSEVRIITETQLFIRIQDAHHHLYYENGSWKVYSFQNQTASLNDSQAFTHDGKTLLMNGRSSISTASINRRNLSYDMERIPVVNNDPYDRSQFYGKICPHDKDIVAVRSENSWVVYRNEDDNWLALLKIEPNNRHNPTELFFAGNGKSLIVLERGNFGRGNSILKYYKISASSSYDQVGSTRSLLGTKVTSLENFKKGSKFVYTVQVRSNPGNNEGRSGSFPTIIDPQTGILEVNLLKSGNWESEDGLIAWLGGEGSKATVLDKENHILLTAPSRFEQSNPNVNTPSISIIKKQEDENDPTKNEWTETAVTIGKPGSGFGVGADFLLNTGIVSSPAATRLHLVQFDGQKLTDASSKIDPDPNTNVEHPIIGRREYLDPNSLASQNYDAFLGGNVLVGHLIGGLLNGKSIVFASQRIPHLSPTTSNNGSCQEVSQNESNHANDTWSIRCFSYEADFEEFHDWGLTLQGKEGDKLGKITGVIDSNRSKVPYEGRRPVERDRIARIAVPITCSKLHSAANSQSQQRSIQVYDIIIEPNLFNRLEILKEHYLDIDMSGHTDDLAICTAFDPNNRNLLAVAGKLPGLVSIYFYKEEVNRIWLGQDPISQLSMYGNRLFVAQEPGGNSQAYVTVIDLTAIPDY